MKFLCWCIEDWDPGEVPPDNALWEAVDAKSPLHAAKQYAEHMLDCFHGTSFLSVGVKNADGGLMWQIITATDWVPRVTIPSMSEITKTGARGSQYLDDLVATFNKENLK